MISVKAFTPHLPFPMVVFIYGQPMRSTRLALVESNPPASLAQWSNDAGMVSNRSMRTLFTSVLGFVCSLAWLAGVVVFAQTPTPQLESYVGAYRSAAGQVIRIMLRRDNLVRGANDMLTPRSDGLFVSKTDGALVKFVKDGAGKVTHLTVGNDKAVRIEMPREVLKSYVGIYPLTANFAMAVTLEGDQLMAQGTGQSKHPLFPESSTTFFVQDYNSDEVAQLEFGTDPPSGAFVVLRQGSAEQKVSRR